jgi:hypothetical protein
LWPLASATALREEFLLLPSLAHLLLSFGLLRRLRLNWRLRLLYRGLLRLGRARRLIRFILAAAAAAPMPLRLSLAVGLGWPHFGLGLGRFCRHACTSWHIALLYITLPELSTRALNPIVHPTTSQEPVVGQLSSRNRGRLVAERFSLAIYHDFLEPMAFSQRTCPLPKPLGVLSKTTTRLMGTMRLRNILPPSSTQIPATRHFVLVVRIGTLTAGAFLGYALSLGTIAALD